MTYEIIATSCYGENNILEKYPVLLEFGFHEEQIKEQRWTRIRDENGQPIRQIEQYYVKKDYIEIDSIDRLTEFIKAVDEEIIISSYSDQNHIEIYDMYRE